MRSTRSVVVGALTAVVATGLAIAGGGGTTSASPGTSAVAGSIWGPDHLPTLSFAYSRDLSVGTRNPDPGMSVIMGVQAGQRYPRPVLAVGLPDQPDSPPTTVSPH